MDLKAKAGDPITATFMNRIIDRLPTEASGFGVGGLGMSRTMVRVSNSSGANRDVGEILALSAFGGSTASAFDANDSLELVGSAPVWHTSIDTIGVCAEPIPTGEQGIVVVSGLCLVKLTAAIASLETHVCHARTRAESLAVRMHWRELCSECYQRDAKRSTRQHIRNCKHARSVVDHE
jgi:hypothetical protein